MNIRIRRIGDGIAGAVIATVILAGGAAYAASGVIDDHPHADTPATDDRLATAPSTTVDDRGGAGTTSTTIDDRGRGGEVRREGTPTTTPAGATPTTPAAPAAGRGGADDGPTHDLGDDHGGRRGDDADDDRDDDRSATSTSTSTPTTVAAPVVRTLQAAGGSVTIRQSGTTLELVTATPNAGWRVEIRHSGGGEIDVRFQNGKRESRVKVEIEDGAARDRVEER